MGRSTIPPALIELSNPSTPEAQVDALRSLKNEIVGHEQRKELAVVHGVVKPLAGLLRAETRKGGKRRKGVTNGSGHTATGARRKWDAGEWSTEDELRFQATLVVGSLANGGPAFIAPLLAGDILPPLLEALSPNETPPKLVVATLRTLNQIVDAVLQEKPWVDWSDNSARSSLACAISEQIYAKPVIESLAEILDQNLRSPTTHQQISWTMKLIIKTCREEVQRKVLLEVGILDLLATKLASIASTDQPNRTQDSRNHEALEFPRMYLSDVLEAISAIIRDSYYHTSRFLYSQSIQSLFGWPKERSASSYNDYAHSSSSTSWDKLIPRVQTLTSKSDPYTKSWPALGSYTPAGTGDSYTRLPSVESFQQQGSGRNVITDEPETPLFIWLMYIARQGEGRERLSACWLLALLKKFGDRWPLNDPPKTTRERHISYLIIPLVVKMIEEANPNSEQARKASSSSPQAKEESRFVLERSPLVLAELITGNKILQTAAVDARILPVLVQILKKSFEPVFTSSKPLWQPKATAPQVRDPMIDPASSTLGKAGLDQDILHAYRYRETSLLALAAIADTQDGLRKLVIEMGAATHIIESLIPFSDSMDTSSVASTVSKDGNPEPVLIAACKVTRSLSRSISVLRTSLIDHGIAQPSFDLLTHPNVKVQIAATEVITNLVLEVSPMRTEIIEAGALKTLCEHCRSANFDLRYGSLWALKHLCLGLPYAMKIQCLEELGVGWLVQVLNGEPAKPATILGMGTSNAAGEQVDILNAAEDPHMDVDEEPSSEEDEDTMTDNIQVNVRRNRPGSRYTTATTIRDRLQTIKNDEQDVRLNGERDDIRIQEQALDFIRNFITEDKASGEMIDHLLKTFGHSRFFELLDAKIRPKNSAAASSTTTASTPQVPAAPSYWTSTSQRTSFSSPASNLSQPAQSQQQPNWAAYPATELIIGTLYILVHLANGRPAHRTILISQTQLMTHVLPLLGHPRRDVRLPCAWFINNLVWVEDNTDEAATRDRAQSLRQLGFEEGARQLGRDMDLDIRERAKTAIEQMGKLLGDNTARSTGPPGGYGTPVTNFAGDVSAGGLSGMGSRLGGLHGHRHGGWGHDSRG